MIPALGTVALTSAVLLAAVACASWALAARRAVAGRPEGAAARLAGWSTAGAWVAAATATALMEWALLAGDFSVSFVAETGSRQLPAYYAATALWAGAGGSLILWLFVLVTITAVAAWRRTAAEFAPHAASMAVLAGLVAAFAALTQFGAVPFQPVDVPLDNGPGPNPLLQDHPAMGIHPPLLYAGFAGLAVPFAMAMGALAAGRVDAAWARSVRPWVLVGWVLLTAGVALGAWWSYSVLGWGGYWAWDPVENASLMPWLLATALLHVLHLPRRTRAWAAGAATLAAAAFQLVILGTLLTRSGALLSVHSFSESSIGTPLLALFGVALIGWVALLAARRDRLGSAPDAGDALFSRQTALRGQVALLTLIATTVFAGTVLPVLVETVTGDRLSVGAPWFNLTVGPPALALLVLMALGPLVAWHRDTTRGLLRRLRWPGVAALATVGLVGLADPGGVLLPVVAGVAAFVAVSLVHRLATSASRRRVGALVAHTGIAIVGLAIVASADGVSEQQTVGVGEAVTSGRMSASLLEIVQTGDDRRASATARVLVGDGATPVATLAPELRLYSGQPTVVASPANVAGIGRDLQVALLEVDPDAGTATLRLTVTPMLTWLWAGAAVAVLGGVVAAAPGRRRPPRGPSSAAEPSGAAVMVPGGERAEAQEVS